MIFEKYKPLILGLWALFSFSVYSGNIYAKQTENTTVPQPVQNANGKRCGKKMATGEPSDWGECSCQRNHQWCRNRCKW